MRPFTKRCCGRLHASSSAERHIHDSGLFGQTGNGLKTVMRMADTSGSTLKISIDPLGKDVIVRPSGRINVESSPGLRDCLSAILSKESLPRAITVDLAGVPYIETSGIATLIEALKIARHRQTIFRLHGLSGSALRLFEVTGLVALFEGSNNGQKVS